MEGVCCHTGKMVNRLITQVYLRNLKAKFYFKNIGIELVIICILKK
jgi:hypothetical protein